MLHSVLVYFLSAAATMLAAVALLPPPWRELLSLVVLALSPAIVVSGIVYGHGVWRAFYIGAAAAGTLPTAFVFLFLHGGWNWMFDHTRHALPEVVFAVFYMCPLVAAGVGGMTAATLYGRLARAEG